MQRRRLAGPWRDHDRISTSTWTSIISRRGQSLAGRAHLRGTRPGRPASVAAFERQLREQIARVASAGDARRAIGGAAMKLDHLERAVVPRRRSGASIRRASSRRRGASPISTCCACRRSPTTIPDPRLGGSNGEDQFARARRTVARLHGDAGRRGRPARRRRAPAPLRQHDPVAAAGAAGVPAPAALPLRSRRARHAAHRDRGGRSRATIGDVRVDHDAPRVLFGDAADGAGRSAADDLRRGPCATRATRRSR